MNEYMDTQQKTVSDILSKLSNKVADLQSLETTAEYQLYYGQGANITAHEKYNLAFGKYQKTTNLAQVGIENDNKCTKVAQSALTTQQDVAVAVANAATAANNVQVAATAISMLAADIGSAYNIAAATDYKSEIFELTSTVNSLISETSGHAEEASWRAMDASAQTAEIIAGQVLKDTNLAKAEIEVILSATTAKLAGLTAELGSDSQKIASTAKAERVFEGALQDQWQNLLAVKSSYVDAVETLNHALTIGIPDKSTPLKKVPVTFNGFQPPFDLTKVGELKDIEQKFRYYILVVPASMRDSFNLEKAESLYARQKSTYFIGCQMPDESGKSTSSINLEKLATDGKAIQEGVSYSLFLYIDIPLAYKKYTNNFTDALSAPTAAINFQQVLNEWTFDVAATVPGIYSLKDGEFNNHMEYRCMYLPVDVKGVNHLMTAHNLDSSFKAGPSFFFDQSVASQVTAANYSKAEPGSTADQLEVKIGDATTDNFGNPLVQGSSYLPVVLAIMVEPNDDNLMNLATTLTIGTATFVPLPVTEPALPLTSNGASS